MIICATILLVSIAITASFALRAWHKSNERMIGERYHLERELAAAENRESLERHRATNCENRYRFAVEQMERMRREQQSSTEKIMRDGSDADVITESMRVLGYGSVPSTEDDHSDPNRAATLPRVASGVIADSKSADRDRWRKSDRKP